MVCWNCPKCDKWKLESATEQAPRCICGTKMVWGKRTHSADVALRAEEVAVGYRACWKETATGNCRMPEGHDGDCIGVVNEIPISPGLARSEQREVPEVQLPDDGPRSTVDHIVSVSLAGVG